jgi:hypothetical protein
MKQLPLQLVYVSQISLKPFCDKTTRERLWIQT